MHYKGEALSFKDFSSEVRAMRDVEQFVHQAEVMLDIAEDGVLKIIERMATKVSCNANQRYKISAIPRLTGLSTMF